MGGYTMASLTTAEVNDLFRWTSDIGMFSSDRPINDIKLDDGTVIEGSCNSFKTEYCEEECYNVKLYRMYENMTKRDVRCETTWGKINAHNVGSIKQTFSRKKNQTKRIRHMSRGEAFTSPTDVYRVKTMCLAMPDTLWWIPTRAWRNARLKALIERELMPLDNCAINASFDPSNTKEEWTTIINSDWNIMFFGDDTLLHDPVHNKPMFKCPKTHKNIKGHCASCKAGCFAQKTIGRTQVVHLSEH